MLLFSRAHTLVDIWVRLPVWQVFGLCHYLTQRIRTNPPHLSTYRFISKYMRHQGITAPFLRKKIVKPLLLNSFSTSCYVSVFYIIICVVFILFLLSSHSTLYRHSHCVHRLEMRRLEFIAVLTSRQKITNKLSGSLPSIVLCSGPTGRKCSCTG